MLNILHLLSQDSFIVYNKHIAHNIGVEESIMLGYLVSRHCYFESTDQLDAQGFFFDTAANRNTQTALKRRKQESAIKHLESLGFIDTKLQGNPAKKHFKICTNKIVQIVQTKTVQIVQSSLDEMNKQDCTKGTNYNKDIRMNNKNERYIYLFNFWNEQNIVVHEKLTEQMEKLIEKRLGQFSEEDIRQSIRNYSSIFKSEETYFKHKWTLEEFLKRANALPIFLHKRVEDYIRWDTGSPPRNAQKSTKTAKEYKEVSVSEL